MSELTGAQWRALAAAEFPHSPIAEIAELLPDVPGLGG